MLSFFSSEEALAWDRDSILFVEWNEGGATGLGKNSSLPYNVYLVLKKMSWNNNKQETKAPYYSSNLRRYSKHVNHELLSS